MNSEKKGVSPSKGDAENFNDPGAKDTIKLSDAKNTFISLYSRVENPNATGEMQIADYLERIRSYPDYAIMVGIYRKFPDKNTDEAKEFKKKIGCVTMSGTFNNPRSKPNLQQHSGYILIDVDQKDNLHCNLLNKRSEIYKDEYLFSGYKSVGGEGLALIYQIPVTNHENYFLSLEKYLADKYEINIDKSCKDVSRLRFHSFDPDLYFNPKAKTWNKELPKKEPKKRDYPVYSSSENFDFVFKQINKDIAPEYSDWLKLSFAFASEFGEAGRDYFHALSQFSSVYESGKCDKQYDNSLKANGTKKSTIATFYYFAREAGYEINSPTTKIIVSKARYCKKLEGKNGSAVDQRKSCADILAMNDIPPEVSIPIINQVFDFKGEEAKISKDELLNQQNEYLANLGIRHNLITNRQEYEGDPITDRVAGDIYHKANIIFPGIYKPYVLNFIQSESEAFNPFEEWFQKHAHLGKNGNIDKLLSCIDGDGSNGKMINGVPYNKYFLERWLISIIASAHGTYSLLMAVMYGPQSSGKSKFFRGLLPQGLQKYFAESTLEDGKDSLDLICSNLIVMNDEWGGLNKRDAKKLKDISSKQFVNQRAVYGRFNETRNRYAVLCGTSNEEDVISDETGNRRVLPFHVRKIDFDIYDSIDKDELWMELYRNWKNVENNWMLTQEDIKLLNENTVENTEEILEDGLISKYYKSPKNSSEDDRYSTTDIKVHIEQLSTSKNLSLKKLGAALKRLGYHKKNFEKQQPPTKGWVISKNEQNSEIQAR